MLFFIIWNINGLFLWHRNVFKTSLHWNSLGSLHRPPSQLHPRGCVLEGWCKLCWWPYSSRLDNVQCSKTSVSHETAFVTLATAPIIIPLRLRSWFGHPLYALKMDCEGCEFVLANDILDHNPHFFDFVYQFNIEIHTPKPIMTKDEYSYDLGRMYRLLRRSGLELHDFDEGTCAVWQLRKGYQLTLISSSFPQYPGCQSFLFARNVTYMHWLHGLKKNRNLHRGSATEISKSFDRYWTDLGFWGFPPSGCWSNSHMKECVWEWLISVKRYEWREIFFSFSGFTAVKALLFHITYAQNLIIHRLPSTVQALYKRTEQCTTAPCTPLTTPSR